jgi:hypothetical protein
VGDDRTPFPGYCLRRYEYFAYENGQIAESYDPGGWYIASRSDYVFSLGPCDPITYLRDYIWQGCERAKASLEKARKRLEEADGRKAKRKARKKLKAAKKRVQQWC